MKHRETFDFSDEERLALGLNGKMASHDDLGQFIQDVVASALPKVIHDYYIGKAKEFELEQ